MIEIDHKLWPFIPPFGLQICGIIMGDELSSLCCSSRRSFILEDANIRTPSGVTAWGSQNRINHPRWAPSPIFNMIFDSHCTDIRMGTQERRTFVLVQDQATVFSDFNKLGDLDVYLCSHSCYCYPYSFLRLGGGGFPHFALSQLPRGCVVVGTHL